MSWWMYDKDKRQLWAIDIEIMGLVFVIGLVVTVVAPQLIRNPAAFTYGSIALMAAGAIAVFTAKVSLFGRGIWVSWGPRQMARGYARMYALGYTLIALGLLLFVLVIKVVDQIGRVP